jgi:hypothetical protein
VAAGNQNYGRLASNDSKLGSFQFGGNFFAIGQGVSPLRTPFSPDENKAQPNTLKVPLSPFGATMAQNQVKSSDTSPINL